MNKTYNLEIDGLQIGSCNEEQLQDLLKTDTKGFTVHECHPLFPGFLESINEKFYNIKYFLDDITSETNPVVTVIREMKYKKLIDYKQFWYEPEDNTINYTSDEYEIEKFMAFIEDLRSPSGNGANIDDFCAEHSRRLYADKIKVPDHFPERTKELEERSKKMLESLMQIYK